MIGGRWTIIERGILYFGSMFDSYILLCVGGVVVADVLYTDTRDILTHSVVVYVKIHTS